MKNAVVREVVARRDVGCGQHIFIDLRTSLLREIDTNPLGPIDSNR